MSDKGFKTAEQMGKEQREISVSEFFEKNRHLLGFDKPTKSLMTVVKEAVDNSLDACEAAGILPEIKVIVKQLSEDRYKVSVQDNGPGIVKEQIPRIFAKLLYGSKFGKNTQGRGQQGIGISSALLYSQLTTGKPSIIRSRVKGKAVHEFHLKIDIAKNEPHIVKDEIYDGSFPEQGTFVEMEIEGMYRKGKQSVDEYLKETSLANPHTKINYHAPDGEKMTFERVASELPKLAKSIRPHPHGVELGVFQRMLKNTSARSVAAFLANDFCRVGLETAKQACKLAKVNPIVKPENIGHDESEKIWRNMQKANFMKPPLDCLSPIGEKVLEDGVKKNTNAEFVAAITRPPEVYRGNPFAVEISVAYGGNLDPKGQAEIIRLANKVPLLYEASACAITKALKEIDWTHYKIESQNKVPTGPLLILVHIYSTWIPYTSESKEAVDAYPEIQKEIKLAIQDCLRKLSSYLSGMRRRQLERQRQSLFEKYIPEVADALSRITEETKARIQTGLEKILKKGNVQEAEEKDIPKEILNGQLNVKEKEKKNLKDFAGGGKGD